MNKKGMTLIELLVVVGILAMLILLAVPNALKAYNNSKKKNFLTDVQTVYKAAISQAKVDNYGKRTTIVYARLNGERPNDNSEELDLTGSTKMDFRIEVSPDGVVQYYAATDGEYQFYYTNPIDDISQITEDMIQPVGDLNEETDTIVGQEQIYVPVYK